MYVYGACSQLWGQCGTICLPIEARGCFIILCPIPRREGLSLNLELCWHGGNPSDALVSAPHMTEVIGVGSHTELINEGARELNPSHDCIAGALTRWTPCLSLRIYLLCFICVMCVCVCTGMCVPTEARRVHRVLMELELHRIVSCSVWGADNQTSVLWKSSKCSKLVSYLNFLIRVSEMESYWNF